MDKNFSTASQARSKNPKHHEPISPSQMPYVRNVLMVWSRDDGVPCFTNDDEGHRFLIVAISLDLPKRKIERLTPWRKEVTPQTWQRIEQTAAQFVPTPINIGMFLKLTNAKRDELAEKRNLKGKRSLRAILQIIPHDVPDWDAELRRRDTERHKKRRSKQQAELMAMRGELLAQHRDPREATLLAVMTQISRQPWPDLSVKNLIRTITNTSAREDFPAMATPLRVAVHRVLHRLERRGVVKTWRDGWLRYAELSPLGRQEKRITTAVTAEDVSPANPLMQHDLTVSPVVPRRRNTLTDKHNRHAILADSHTDGGRTGRHDDGEQHQTTTMMAPDHGEQHHVDEGRHLERNGTPKRRPVDEEGRIRPEDITMMVLQDEATARWRVVDDTGTVIAHGFATDAAAWAWFDACDACLKN